MVLPGLVPLPPLLHGLQHQQFLQLLLRQGQHEGAETSPKEPLVVLFDGLLGRDRPVPGLGRR